MKDFLFIDTEILTAMIYPNIPSRPGIIPAKNNCPISWLVIIPYKTSIIEGGIKIPKVPPAAIDPVAKESG